MPGPVKHYEKRWQEETLIADRSKFMVKNRVIPDQY